MSRVAYRAFTGISVSTGTVLQVALPLPGRGLLHSVICKQTGGTANGMKLELFNDRRVCVPNVAGYAGVSPPVPAGRAAPAEELCWIIAPLASVDGSPAVVSHFIPNAQAYATVHACTQDRYDEIYARITPTGGITSKTFELAFHYAVSE